MGYCDKPSPTFQSQKNLIWIYFPHFQIFPAPPMPISIKEYVQRIKEPQKDKYFKQSQKLRFTQRRIRIMMVHQTPSLHKLISCILPMFTSLVFDISGVLSFSLFAENETGFVDTHEVLFVDGLVFLNVDLTIALENVF